MTIAFLKRYTTVSPRAMLFTNITKYEELELENFILQGL